MIDVSVVVAIYKSAEVVDICNPFVTYSLHSGQGKKGISRREIAERGGRRRSLPKLMLNILVTRSGK